MPATAPINEPPMDDAVAAVTRRLAAILSADVVGYSRLMERDETGTLARLNAHRREFIEPLIAEHHGRLVKLMGDGALCEFGSVVDAVACAVAVQKGMAERETDLPSDQRIRFRIGINLGDIILEGDDLYGDGVNIAARVEALAPPGGIAITAAVREQVRHKLALAYRDLGRHRVKNIAEPVHIFAVDWTGEAPAGPPVWARRIVSSPVLIVLLMILLAVGVAELWLAVRAPVPTGSPAEGSPSAKGPDELVGKPVVAVLPFVNQSGDAGQEYYSDGITEDLIAGLGRFSNLGVLARHSVFAYKGKPVEPARLSRDLGARYLVEGSVRKLGDRIRLSVQLSDSQRGLLLWSERYDEAADRIFAVQDDIVKRITGVLAVRLTRAEQDRAFAKPTSNLDAYDLVLRARQLLAKRTRAGNVEGRELLRRAISIDPTYAAAYTELAWAYLHAAWNGWTEWPAAAVHEAESFAAKALALDPNQGPAYLVQSMLRLEKRDYAGAALDLDRAVELIPNDIRTLRARGRVLMFSGEIEKAVEVFETADRFDPQQEIEQIAMTLGLAYFMAGRYDAAIRTLERHVRQFRDRPDDSMAILAAAYAEAGRPEDAARAAAEVRRITPFFEVEVFGSLFREPADRERLHTALRKAGLG